MKNRRRLLGAAAICLVAAAAGAAEPAERTLVIEGVVDAPPEVVWELWTTAKGLRSWMAPHAEIDLRVGGRMRANYDPAGELGDAKTITNTILSYDPGRMLSIKATGLPEGFPYPEAIADMWTVIYLEPLADGRTYVRTVGLGFAEGPSGDRLYEFFERGNSVTLESLQRRAAELRAAAREAAAPAGSR